MRAQPVCPGFGHQHLAPARCSRDARGPVQLVGQHARIGQRRTAGHQPARRRAALHQVGQPVLREVGARAIAQIDLAVIGHRKGRGAMQGRGAGIGQRGGDGAAGRERHHTVPGHAGQQPAVECPRQRADRAREGCEGRSLLVVGAGAAQNVRAAGNVQRAVGAGGEIVGPFDRFAQRARVVQPAVGREGAVEHRDGMHLPVRVQHAVDEVTQQRHQRASFQ